MVSLSPTSHGIAWVGARLQTSEKNSTVNSSDHCSVVSSTMQGLSRDIPAKEDSLQCGKEH